MALKNGEQGRYVSDMSTVPRTDGAYRMTYINKETKKMYLHTFGYYTNGIPLDDEMVIRIEKDSLIFDDPAKD